MGAFLDLFRVLWEPTAVFERVREKPRFLAPFIGIAVIQVIVGFLQLPYLRAAMAGRLAQAAQANAAAAEAAQKFVGVGIVLAPIVIGVFLVLTALVLWVLVSVMGGEGKFATCLSVATYSAITGMLLQVVGIIVLMLKGVGGVTTPEDLQPALGLDLAVPAAKGFVGALLRGINPFSIWGVVLTGIGISVTHKQSRSTGYTVAIIAAVITLVIGAGLAAMGSRAG